MKAKVTPLRIDRYNRNGNADHIVNLRKNADRLQPVCEKKKVMQATSDKIFHHSILSDQYIDYKNDISVVKNNIKTTIDNFKANHIAESGNILLAYNDTEIRHYLYDHENGYRKLRKIPNCRLYTKKKEVRQFNKPNQSGNISLYNDFDTLVSELYQFISDNRSDNFYRGSIILTTAYEMIDGSHIMHNNYIAEDLEQIFSDDQNYLQYPAWSKELMDNELSPCLVWWKSTSNSFDDQYYSLNQFASKITASLMFHQDYIEALDDYRDIIKSINLYAHYNAEVLNYDIDQESDKYNVIRRYAEGSGGAQIIHSFYHAKKLEKEVYEHFTFRKIASININDLKAGDNEIIVDLSNYNTKEVLNIDNNSHHTLISVHDTYNFNNSLHLVGVRTKLGEGNDNYFRLKAYNDNDMLKQLYNVSLNATWGADIELYQYAELKENGKTYYVRKKLYATILNTAHGGYWLFNNIIMYPDSRATRIIITAENNQLITEFSLTPSRTHNSAININYIDDDHIAAMSNVRVIFNNPGKVVNFNTDTIIEQKNRIQVSETDNPLFFPSQYSYSVNDSEEITAIGSVAEEIGSGQRGIFSLFLFTSAQIYALQPGQDTMYQQITPLHRIRAEGQKKVSFSNRIFFVSDNDIYMMNNQGAIEIINQPLQGEAISINYESIDHADFLSDSILLYDNHNSELIVSNSRHQFSYVYQLKENSWYQRSEFFTGNYTRHSNIHLMRDNNVYDTRENDNTLPFLIQTNEIFLGDDYSKIIRSAAVGRFITIDETRYTLHGSTLASFTPVQSARTRPYQNSMTLILLRNQSSHKSYIISIEGRLSNKSYFQEFIIDYESRLNKKIR